MRSEENRIIDKTNQNRDNSKWWKKVFCLCFGFLFRTFTMVFLFLYGIKVVTLDNEVTRSFKVWWLFKLMGVGIIFISLYLLFNLYSKKVSKETYINWAYGFVGALIIAYMLLASYDYIFG